MKIPIYDLGADADWGSVVVGRWRELPDSEPTDDDEDIPTPRHVIDVLGFDPDEEDWDDVTDNVYCPTGPGGGVDPSCSPGGSGSGTTVFSPSPGLFDKQPTAVLRLMGKQGWTFKEAKRVLEARGVSLSDHTLRRQLREGKTEEGGLKPAELTDEQRATLDMWRTHPEPYKGGTLDPAPRPSALAVTTPPKAIADVQPTNDPRPPTGISRPPVVTEFTHKVWAKLNSGDRDVSHLKEVGTLIRNEIESRLSPSQTSSETVAFLRAEREALRATVFENVDAKTIHEKQHRITELSKQIEPERYGLQSPQQVEYQQKLREVLSEVRQMGDPSLLSVSASRGATRTAEVLKEATVGLPKEWITEENVTAVSSDRGYHRSGTSHRGVKYSAQISLGPSSADKEALAPTATHELIHAAEAKNPELGNVQREFLRLRIDPNERVSQIARGEWGYKDGFSAHYCGRIYNHGGKGTRPGSVPYGTHFEVLSMGVEGLLHGNRPIRNDADYTHFVLGCLAGL